MTLATALQIAAAIHKSFSTDAGAAEYLLSDTAEHQVEALRFLTAHPARFSGRPSLRRAIEDAIKVFRTVERLQAA